MKTIEQAVAFHHSLRELAAHPGGYIDGVSTMSGWASNQEDYSLTFKTLIATSDIPPGDARYTAFRQGFYAIEINIVAKIGGRHHDGSPRTETEIDIHVLDRLSGGMATKTWHTRGIYSAEVIADDEVHAVVKSILAAARTDLPA